MSFLIDWVPYFHSIFYCGMRYDCSFNICSCNSVSRNFDSIYLEKIEFNIGLRIFNIAKLLCNI